MCLHLNYIIYSILFIVIYYNDTFIYKSKLEVTVDYTDIFNILRSNYISFIYLFASNKYLLIHQSNVKSQTHHFQPFIRIFLPSLLMFAINECELTITKAKPVLAIISAMLTTAALIDKGFEPQLLNLLLPFFMSNYLPSIIANGIVKRFSIEFNCTLLNFIGMVLGLFLYKQRVFLRLLGDLPTVSKVFSFLSLVHNHEDTNELIQWLIVKELSAICIRKFMLGKSMRIRRIEFINAFLCIFVLYMVRKYYYDDRLIIVAIFIVPISKLFVKGGFGIVDKIKNMRKTKEETKTATKRKTTRKNE